MTNQKDIAISAENVKKSFMLNHEATTSVKSGVLRLLDRRKRHYVKDELQVLKGISFDIEKGDFVGIVGRNGGGKSTLLKIIAGIYQPTSGSVTINGTLIPFIELGVGFNPELTGRENVYLNGALFGFSKKEIEAMYDDIVDFAELHQFMDQKLKNYSSGMQVRLAFSVAIKAQGDILVLDEVLAVGDEAFQRKCSKFFEQIKKDKSKTIILVTHTMENVRKYCDKAIMLRGGKIVNYGSPDDVANEYSVENLETNKSNKHESDEHSLIDNIKVELLSPKVFSQEDTLKIKVSYDVPSSIPTKLRISLQDIDRNFPLFAASSPIIDKDRVSAVLSTRINTINDSNLKISISIRDKNDDTVGFLSDSASPVVALKRTDYPDPTRKTTWATLFDRGEWSL